MRIILVLLAIVFGALTASDARAFCLMSCEPTEADGQKVFENLVRRNLPNIAFTVVSFKKTNGMTVNGPVESYQMFIEALISLPQGANPDCNPNGGTPNFKDPMSVISCSTGARKYWPAGQNLSYKESYIFQKTEKGWLGQDGVVY